jgi:hypothetical protein
MTNSSAAVVVLNHYPTEDEVDEITYEHLEKFDADYATAVAQIVRIAPSFMSICEQDQINAFIRDGGPRTHILVVYMEEAEEPDENDEYEDDE